MAIEWVTDAERTALYGVCDVCNAPRDCAELEFEDGGTLMQLICSAKPMEHPA